MATWIKLKKKNQLFSRTLSGKGSIISHRIIIVRLLFNIFYVKFQCGKVDNNMENSTLQCGYMLKIPV
jgi:hypothetical protein